MLFLFPYTFVTPRLGNRSTVLPMHGKKEIGKGLEQRIKKDLGLK